MPSNTQQEYKEIAVFNPLASSRVGKRIEDRQRNRAKGLFKSLFNRNKTQHISASRTASLDDAVKLSVESAERKVDNKKGEASYDTYEGRVAAILNKYNSVDSLGSSLVRSIIDLRTSFITGEELSISSKDEKFVEWVEDFLDKNNFQSQLFIQAVKGAELTGQALFVLKPSEWRNSEKYVEIKYLPFRHADNQAYSISEYRPVYTGDFAENFSHIEVKPAEQALTWRKIQYEYYTYVRVGGDDSNLLHPTSKTCSVLPYIDSYDTALNDIRLLNYIGARITPVFETNDSNKAAGLRKNLSENGWKIGEAVVGAAKFYYATPSTGANVNLVNELTAYVKSISVVTGVPVHWLGFTEILSNRSTAETLYDLIKNATINDRSLWQDAIYDLICKAQELYLEMGGTGLSKINYDFKVTLPLIDFSSYRALAEALSIAFQDGAISLQDYRSELPGIDPVKTAKLVQAEMEERRELANLRRGSEERNQGINQNTGNPQKTTSKRKDENEGRYDQERDRRKPK